MHRERPFEEGLRFGRRRGISEFDRRRRHVPDSHPTRLVLPAQIDS